MNPDEVSARCQTEFDDQLLGVSCVYAPGYTRFKELLHLCNMLGEMVYVEAGPHAGFECVGNELSRTMTKNAKQLKYLQTTR